MATSRPPYQVIVLDVIQAVPSALPEAYAGGTYCRPNFTPSFSIFS